MHVAVKIGMLVLGSVTMAIGVERAFAICNLIPPAERFFPSTVGRVSAPIAAPGDTIEIRLEPRCDQPPTLFSAIPAENHVTLTFTPPAASGGTETEVEVADVTPLDPGGGSALALAVRIPDTVSVQHPRGLAGPARIAVRVGGSEIARVDKLFEPNASCEKIAEGTFERFTVLPPPNDFAALSSGTSGQILATLDGGDNLVIPFDYTAVLPLGVGAPVARLLRGSVDVDARTSNPGVPIHIPSSSFVRSFTLTGRPLPPLLRVDAGGRVLFGTADGDRGILRISRNDGTPGIPDIYDFTDRFSGGVGPIVIDRIADGFAAQSDVAVPLRGLRSSPVAAGFVRDESVEGAQLNGDLDTSDRVAQILDLSNGAPVNTGVAVVELRSGASAVPAIEAAGPFVAMLESERAQGVDRNGDSDRNDALLRVFEATGSGTPVELTAGTPASERIATTGTALNGKSFVLSNDVAFFLSDESAALGEVTSRANVGFGGAPPNDGISFFQGAETFPPSKLSYDGRYVIFSTRATNLVDGGNAVEDVFVYDRVLDRNERVNVDNDGVACTHSPDPQWGVALSGDGRIAAFYGDCESLLSPGEPVTNANVYLRDLENGVTERITAVSQTFPSQPAVTMSLSFDGQTLAFYSAADLVPGSGPGGINVFVYDRRSHTTENVSPGIGGLYPSLSADGRFVVFQSDGTIQLHDRCVSNGVSVLDCTASTEALSRCANGAVPPGPSFGPALSADGSTVAFRSWVNLDTDCTLAPPIPPSPYTPEVLFVLDRSTGAIERVADNAYAATSLSGDGRVIAFTTNLGLLPEDGNDAGDVYRYDRLLGVTELVSADASGSALCPPGVLSDSFGISGDGRTMGVWIRCNGYFPAPTVGIELYLRGPDPNAAGVDLDGDGDSADVVLQAFDARSGALRPRARIATKKAAVAGGRALVSTPAGALALYDGTSPADVAPEPLSGSAREIALSDQVLAVTRPFASAGTLALRGVAGPGPLVERPDLVADAIAAVGDAVAFTTPERLDGLPRGSDLNGDGDRVDRVLRIYHSADGAVTETGQAVADFVADGSLVVFRTPEAEQGCAGGPDCIAGARDLNGDGDTLDFVLQIYDLRTHDILSTGQAAIPCTLAGCEPGVLYRIKGDSVAFLTREADQGAKDLDGNGSAGDVVVQVFNVVSRATQVYPLAPEAPGVEPPPLPETLFDESILYVSARESDVGRDLNGDGVVTGAIVTLVVGDQDGDQVYDDASNASGDVCVDIPDSAQQDSDLDGVGDACDVMPYCAVYLPPAPSAVPVEAISCQTAIQRSARTYLRKRTASLRECFRRVDPDAAARCVGTLGTDGESPPTDGDAARRLADAVAKLDASIRRACSGAQLADLDTCADRSVAPTVDGLLACVRATYDASALAVSRLTYGQAGPIRHPAARSCQRAVGRAAMGYLDRVLQGTGECLGRFARGGVNGGASSCLGETVLDATTSEVHLEDPTDRATGGVIAGARAALAKRIADGCPGTVLADPELQVCGEDPAGVAACLECTQWRRAMAGLRAVFGPR